MLVFLRRTVAQMQPQSVSRADLSVQVQGSLAATANTVGHDRQFA